MTSAPDTDEDDGSSLGMLADYECPECGRMDELDLTEDEATLVFAGDASGNMICPNDWCEEELELTLEAAAANLEWIKGRLNPSA